MATLPVSHRAHGKTDITHIPKDIWQYMIDISQSLMLHTIKTKEALGNAMPYERTRQIEQRFQRVIQLIAEESLNAQQAPETVGLEFHVGDAYGPPQCLGRFR